MNQTLPAADRQASRNQREEDLRAPIIRVRNLEKTYTTARGPLTLFHGLDLDVIGWTEAGQHVGLGEAGDDGFRVFGPHGIPEGDSGARATRADCEREGENKQTGSVARATSS